MKPYTLARIATRNGDLRKPWYVHYDFLKPGKSLGDPDAMARIRVKGGINRYHTKTERMEAARALQFQQNDLLRHGFNPFTGDDEFWQVPTVEQAFNEFTKFKSVGRGKNGKGLSRRTIYDYRSMCGALVVFLSGKGLAKRDVTVITDQHLTEYLDAKLEGGDWNNTTRNNHIVMLSVAFNYFIKKKWIVKNPLHDVYKMPVEYGSKNTPPSDEQFRKIFRHLYKADRALCRYASLIYNTAFRTSEVGSIRIKDIRLNEKRPVIILNSESDKENEKRVKDISPPLYKLLLEDGIDKLNPDWYLFSDGLEPGPEFKRTIRNMVDLRWQAVVKKGLKIDVDLYSMKHKIVADLIERGENFKNIMDFTGHKDYRSFLKYARSVTPVNNKSFLKHFKPMPFQRY